VGHEITKEALNKSSAADGGSFSSIHRYEKLEIHKVFLRFPYLDLPKNLSPSTLVDLIRASQKKCLIIPAHYDIIVGTVCIFALWADSGRPLP
jgi:hypothetical protein